MKRAFASVLAGALGLLLLSGCGGRQHLPALPPPETDAAGSFGVDANINMDSIDGYLDRPDVAYRDVRMLFDPADYGAIGGEADLTATIEGFKIVPFPYVATLQSLPVANAYDGPRLFDVVWSPEGTVVSAAANYAESQRILEELFPRDRAIFLMCGGGGYSNMMKQLLLFLGWDGEKLYNIGGNWSYDGSRGLELVVYPEKAGEPNIYATWRADYAYLDFTRLTPQEVRR